MDRGRVARSTVDRRWRGMKAPERGGALTGAWPMATPEHANSPAWAQQRERGTWGTRLGPHRGSGGGVAIG
jgi:hypothetical protein